MIDQRIFADWGSSRSSRSVAGTLVCSTLRTAVGVGPSSCTLIIVTVGYLLALGIKILVAVGQYSSASMMVITRSVTDRSAASGPIGNITSSAWTRSITLSGGDVDVSEVQGCHTGQGTMIAPTLTVTAMTMVSPMIRVSSSWHRC